MRRARIEISGLLGALHCVLGLACGSTESRVGAPPLQPCRLENLGVEARCGEHRVLEDRGAKGGREIRLHFAVVPALAARAAPDPLFILVGGPGQAATEAGAVIAQALPGVRRTRDIVLLDQRGTGRSKPLDCKEYGEQSLARRLAPRLDLAETRACLAALDADTTQYATPMAVADLDELREVLGYEQVNLWGGSYGTRAALVYAREHPERVRSLVLDGVAPTAIELPSFFPRDAQRALDLLFDDCAADVDCNAAFPHAREELAALLARLEAAPATVTLSHPRTGQPETVNVERDGLASVLLQLLYVPELAGLIPLGVQRAARGDYATLVAATEAFADSVELSTGMFMSVVCAEDVPRIDASEIEARTRGTFLGKSWLEQLRSECGEWPSARLPESYFAPLRSAAPVLLLSGQLDPATPPGWAEEVARGLRRFRHIIVPGAGHGVTRVGCVPKLIREFLDTLAPEALDTACVERSRRPPFFTSLAGPKP